MEIRKKSEWTAPRPVVRDDDGAPIIGWIAPRAPRRTVAIPRGRRYDRPLKSDGTLDGRPPWAQLVADFLAAL
jgi:hypothetical protein